MKPVIAITFTDQCPYLEREWDVKIQYLKQYSCGTPAPVGYHKHDLLCQHYNECTVTEGKFPRKCPVFQNAPDDPRQFD